MWKGCPGESPTRATNEGHPLGNQEGDWPGKWPVVRQKKNMGDRQEQEKRDAKEIKKSSN